MTTQRVEFRHLGTVACQSYCNFYLHVRTRIYLHRPGLRGTSQPLSSKALISRLRHCLHCQVEGRWVGYRFHLQANIARAVHKALAAAVWQHGLFQKYFRSSRDNIPSRRQRDITRMDHSWRGNRFCKSFAVRFPSIGGDTVQIYGCTYYTSACHRQWQIRNRLHS